jgi:hypothetical protein
LHLEVDNAAIIAGMTVTLSWETTDAQIVEIDNGISNVAVSGKLNIMPRGSTLYKLTAKGHFGECSKIIKVRVFPSPEIKTIPVSLPTFSGRIDFEKLRFMPPVINVSVDVRPVTAQPSILPKMASIAENFKTRLLTRQSALNISWLFDLIKRKLINQ